MNRDHYLALHYGLDHTGWAQMLVWGLFVCLGFWISFFSILRLSLFTCPLQHFILEGNLHFLIHSRIKKNQKEDQEPPQTGVGKAITEWGAMWLFPFPSQRFGYSLCPCRRTLQALGCGFQSKAFNWWEPQSSSSVRNRKFLTCEPVSRPLASPSFWIRSMDAQGIWKRDLP